MKKKDLVYLIGAVAILLVSGYVVYTQLLGNKGSKSTSIKVEVAGKIDDKIEPVEGTIERLRDPDMVDYTIKIDDIPAGNTALFGR